jgi:saccharopine dehydrogenase (NADP+, L-glutamate forming)
MNKVLILGAGMVVKPMVEYLLGNNIEVMIASPMKDRADEMINGHPLGSSLDWSMDDPSMLDSLVSKYDITVSLLPYKYHSDVAVVCLRYGKSLVTTSYIQPGMKDLEESAKNAGLIFLNEIGLDPGIDHMTAMRIIDHIHSSGGKVEEFYSLCGALPAPESANNPMKYKFSWSPKGVVLASRNSALYLKNGRQVYIEPSDLFKDTFDYFFPGIGNLEVYPNRDSVSFMDIYGIPETKTMYRGTFRYKGWCETLDVMKGLNMLDDSVKNYQGMSYAEFLADRAKVDSMNLKQNLITRFGIKENSVAIQSLEFLDFFSSEKLQYTESTPFEITSDRMIKKMMLGTDDRDMVALQHVVLASYPDGHKEVIKSSMLDYGTPSTNTSIARTVALPAAIAVRMILENRIDVKGVLRPVIPQIYNPVLDELKTLGVEMKEEFGLPESEML